MSAATSVNLEQKRKLDLLVQDTLGKGRELNMQRVQVELGIGHETARNLLYAYVKKGVGHYNPKEHSYFPNLL